MGSRPFIVLMKLMRKVLPAGTLLLLIQLQSLAVKCQTMLTFNANNATLQSVLGTIKTQSGYGIVFTKESLKNTHPLTVSFKNQPLTTVLDHCFEGQPVTYKIVERSIIVTERIKENKVASFVDDSTITVSGQVAGKNGPLLIGASVKLKGSAKGVTTDAEGRFSIDVLPKSILTVSYVGYKPFVIRATSNTTRLSINLEQEETTLGAINISQAGKVKDPMTRIDLTNRGYMNLGQVLQGTVPGLTLQTVNSTSTTVTSIKVWKGQTLRFVDMTVDQFLKDNPANGQQIIDALVSGNIPSWLNKSLYVISKTTTVSTSLVPELRGTNSFSGNISGMLIVIDGFPKDGFPSDYPMNNVESIEVIKDPKELIKWGSRANGGAILIKTKGGKTGQLQVNYAANIYYEPAPKYDRKKLQLASTADILDYTLQADSLFSQNRSNPSSTFNVNQASWLLTKLHCNLLTQDEFNKQWAALGKLSNE